MMDLPTLRFTIIAIITVTLELITKPNDWEAKRFHSLRRRLTKGKRS